MEKIPFTMIFHKHVDGSDTIFSTMSGTLVKNPLGKLLVVIRIMSYQVASGDSRCSYEPVKDVFQI